MSVKDIIQKRRKELGISQTELAKRAGLQPPAISQYESGARTPSYEALIKLSNALETNVDYLISGASGTNSTFPLDKKSELIIKMIGSLSLESKDKVIEYISFLGTGNKITNMDEIFSEPSEYAEYIRKKYTNGNLPLDLYDLALQLGINVYHSDTNNDYEGVLFKGENVIFLDKTKLPSRIRFTLATLIGHSILPWHIKSSYYVRKRGSSTLLTEDLCEMEAHKFATILLVPPDHLKDDFENTIASLPILKNLADEKYKVSLFLLANRLIESAKDKYSMVQTESDKIIKTYPGKRHLKEIGVNVDHRSKAASFFNNIPANEEIRQGQVPAECWLTDADANENIYEESIFNPKLGTVLTLLRF